ncbi:HAD family hydrolase [Rhodococcoides fascians]|uniref:HAD family hydrolase n=1 Tax=Rhodococcoides fascians TaxID=1828 RepID=UPI0006895E4F|nr:HAD family hydrolase [Rhodococcus fascians]
MHRPILLLDFDGTVCLGDDPVRAYADAVADGLDTASAETLRAGLTAFLETGAGEYLDGYSAVQHLSMGVDAATLAAAYAHSRERLAAGELEVWAPAGLAAFLGRVSAEVVLATNAPQRGVLETLERLGLTGLMDRVFTDAGKPEKMPELVESLLDTRPPHLLASVGDIWRNDLDAPHRRGALTAYIDRHGHPRPEATFCASTFQAMYDELLEWSTDPAAFALTHEGQS